MNELKVFDYDGQEVRTVEHDNATWWVLKDVCDVLELTTPSRVAERLDGDEVSQTHVIDSIGRQQETIIINESGLYNVIIRSDKPKAKKFKRWVTHEVLPSIRKHGAYMTDNTIEAVMSDPENFIKLAQALHDERKQKVMLEDDIERNRPKVIFADAVSVSNTDILVGELAKLIKGTGVDIGQKRLFSWMRENGYLIKRSSSEYNMPTQKSMNLGLFKIKETVITHADGHTSISKTPKVTGKGQQYFINVFQKGE